MVNCYRDIAHLDRTTFNDLPSLVPLFPTLGALVIFPKFDILELIRLASTGWLLPPGITRTTVPLRALHVNYPLSELASDRPLTEKNAALQNMLRQRFLDGKAKMYTEPTVFFDE